MKKVVPADAVLIPDTAKCVFTGKIFAVYQWPQQLFNGKTATFEMLKRPDTVQAICIVDNKILVLNDEQPHRSAKLTFPGGRVDADEDTGTAAKREVREETGYEFTNWRLVDAKQPYTKIEWFIQTYLAWDVKSKNSPHLDNGEIITATQLPLHELKQLAADKAGYLGETDNLLAHTHTIDDLLALPEFKGQTVDRD